MKEKGDVSESNAFEMKKEMRTQKSQCDLTMWKSWMTLIKELILEYSGLGKDL
jgi:hypothetical protein